MCQHMLKFSNRAIKNHRGPVFIFAAAMCVHLSLFYNNEYFFCQLSWPHPFMWGIWKYVLLCVFFWHILADPPEKYDENLIEVYVCDKEVDKITG